MDKAVCGCAVFRWAIFCRFLRFIFRERDWSIVGIVMPLNHSAEYLAEEKEDGTIRRKSGVEKRGSLMQNNSTIVGRFIEETINQGQIDSAAQFVWEDVVEQVPFPGQGPGLEGLKDTSARDAKCVP
jgi:hypothetical protein